MTSPKIPQIDLNNVNWKLVASAVAATAVVGGSIYYLTKSSSTPTTDKKSKKKSGSKKKKTLTPVVEEEAKVSVEQVKLAPEVKTEEVEAEVTEKKERSDSGSVHDEPAFSTPTEALSTLPESIKSSKAYQSRPDLFPENISEMAKKERTSLAKEAKMAGNKLYGEKKWDEAIEMYTQAIALNPDAIYYCNRAACQSNLGQHDKAIEDCTAALKLDSSYAKAMNRRAAAYEKLERYSDAMNDITTVCVLEDFKNEITMNGLDRILKQLAATRAAEILKTKVRKLPSNVFMTAYLDSFTYTNKIAQELQSHTTTTPAETKVVESMKWILERNYAESYESLLEAFRLAELDDEAGLKDDFIRTEAYVLRSTFRFLIGDWEGAMTDIETVLNTNPKHINALIKKASYVMERADIQTTFSIFESIYSNITKTDPDFFYHRGQVKFLTNDAQGAVNDYQKAATLAPDFLFAKIQWAVSLYRLGEQGKSEKLFKELAKKYGDSVGDVWNYWGEVLMDMGKVQEAMGHFDKALALNPSSPLPYINKAAVAIQIMGDMAMAEAFCSKALEVDPLCDLAYVQLGQIKLTQSQVEEAIAYYDKAVELARTEPELMNAIATREAAVAQKFVVDNYPELAEKLKKNFGQMQ